MSANELAQRPALEHGDGAARPLPFAQARIPRPAPPANAAPRAKKLAVPVKRAENNASTMRLKTMLVFFGFWMVVTLIAVLIFAGRL